MNLLTDERCSKIASLWKPGMIMSERASSRRCQALPNDKAPRDKRPGNIALKTNVSIVRGKGTKKDSGVGG